MIMTPSAMDRNHCPPSIGTAIRNGRNPYPRSVYLLGGHGCCTLYEKSRLGALLCLDSSSFRTGYRFPMPRAKEPRGAWPLHCERHFEPIKVSGSVGAAR